MVSKKCQHCNTTYQSIKSAYRKYCSFECYQDARGKLKKIKCKICGSFYSTRKNSPKKYCSAKCYNKARERGLRENKVAVPCAACGKDIMFFPSQVKKAKRRFCSDECRSTPSIPKQCVICGKEFLVTYHKAHDAKYCSTDCHNIKVCQGQDHKNAPKAELVCEQCRNPFKVRRSMSKVQRYCSQKCAGIAIGSRHSGENSPVWKPKYKIVCAHCNKEFETHESRHERAKYCSRRCATLGNMDRFAAGERTDIEKAMANALKQYKIRFTEQVVMFDKFMVDFLLSDYPIIVQCDGRFWHDRPRTKDRDTGQDRYLAKTGYTVLRFDDKQINGDINTCIKRIKQAIKKPSQIPLINSV